MRQFSTLLIGKFVYLLMRLRGGGSALPGLIVEKIDPKFVSRILAKLPRGVAVISGTNGKTTTTKMVTELLESAGLNVFTNRTGSNFSRGVAAALLSQVDMRGRLPADVAVLELDEAHAVNFVKAVPPRYSLLLNVMRDQLDRFGEIDAAAAMLQKIAVATTDTVVLNREDSRIASIGDSIPESVSVRYFGLSEHLQSTFPASDDTPVSDTVVNAALPQAEIILSGLSNSSAEFTIADQPYSTRLKLQGIYNVYNAAAALCLAKTVLGDAADDAQLVSALAEVTPAFGRGETLSVNGQPLELVLVKNPGGFRLGLKSFDPIGYSTMIAVNDNYADGRDLSWLWDVDFGSLKAAGVSQVAGARAYDMALRLQYDEVDVASVTPDLASALKDFVSGSNAPKRIYCTYTAMLALRRELAKMTKVETVS